MEVAGLQKLEICVTTHPYLYYGRHAMQCGGCGGWAVPFDAETESLTLNHLKRTTLPGYLEVIRCLPFK